MPEASLADRIRRVEETPLRELVKVGVEDVEVQMDSLLEGGTTAESLYRRWETQQWAVSELDLEQDKVDWGNLSPGLQTGIHRTMTAFFVGEQAVTDTLGPILHAAPREDERIFLATQVADEARHTVFFQRYFSEVIGVSGGLNDILSDLHTKQAAGFKRIFDDYLVEAVDRCRLDPRDRRAWVDAVTTYHLVVEGYLALSGQRVLLRNFRTMGMLPGFTAGFTAVARDESRHIGFGVLALRRRVQEDPEMARVITVRILELMDAAVHVVVAPDVRLHPAIEDPNNVLPAIRTNPDQLRSEAIAALSKRVRAIGLSETAIREVEHSMIDHYEAAWAEYERNHETLHPVSYWRRGLVAKGA
jgi:ribonucleoside-diphosphate reductase beta chain